MKRKFIQSTIIVLGALTFLGTFPNDVSARTGRHYIGQSYRQENRRTYGIRYRCNGGQYTRQGALRSGSGSPWRSKVNTDVIRGYARRGGYPSYGQRRPQTVPVERFYRR